MDWIQCRAVTNKQENLQSSDRMASRKICIATNILKSYRPTLSVSMILRVLPLLQTLHSVVLTNTSRYGPIGASLYSPLQRCGCKQVALSDASRESETWE